MQHVLVLITTLITLAFVACSGAEKDAASSNNASSDWEGGRFIDRAVYGLKYTTSTSKISGTTDQNGGFECERGELVTFYLGNLSLGSSPCSRVIFPTNLTEEAEPSEEGGAVAMGVLFQLLNEKSNNSNTSYLEIPQSVHNVNFSSSFEFKNFTSTSNMTSFENLLSEINKQSELEIDLALIKSEYTIRAQNSQTELLKNINNPTYYQTPPNIADYVNRGFSLKTTLNVGESDPECISLHRVSDSFGLGIINQPLGDLPVYKIYLGIHSSYTGVIRDYVLAQSTVSETEPKIRYTFDYPSPSFAEYPEKHRETIFTFNFPSDSTLPPQVTANMTYEMKTGETYYCKNTIIVEESLLENAPKLVVKERINPLDNTYFFGKSSTQIVKTLTIKNTGINTATVLSVSIKNDKEEIYAGNWPSTRCPNEIPITGGIIAIPSPDRSYSAFDFTGGHYPGVNGTCSAEIPAQSECKIELRFNPSILSNSTLENFSLSYGYKTPCIVDQNVLAGQTKSLRFKLKGESATNPVFLRDIIESTTEE